MSIIILIPDYIYISLKSFHQLLMYCCEAYKGFNYVFNSHGHCDFHFVIFSHIQYHYSCPLFYSYLTHFVTS